MSEGKPLDLEESEIKKEFEKWYYSKKFVPHGMMWTYHSYEGFRTGVEFMKQRIKEACMFYLEWKNKPRQFIEKYPKYEKILIRKCIYYPKNNEINYYNFQEWLFKLAFKGVFEKGEKRK